MVRLPSIRKPQTGQRFGAGGGPRLMTFYIRLKTTVVASGSTPPKKTHLCTDMDQEFDGQRCDAWCRGRGWRLTGVVELDLKGDYGASLPQRVRIRTFNSPPSIANIPRRARTTVYSQWSDVRPPANPSPDSYLRQGTRLRRSLRTRSCWTAPMR